MQAPLQVYDKSCALNHWGIGLFKMPCVFLPLAVMKVLSVFLVRGASADGTYFDDVLFLLLYYRQHKNPVKATPCNGIFEPFATSECMVADTFCCDILVRIFAIMARFSSPLPKSGRLEIGPDWFFYGRFKQNARFPAHQKKIRLS